MVTALKNDFTKSSSSQYLEAIPQFPLFSSVRHELKARAGIGKRLTPLPQWGEEEVLIWTQCSAQGFVGMEQSTAHVPWPDVFCPHQHNSIVTFSLSGG